MRVGDIKKLTEGKPIDVLNGQGQIIVDFENNVFLAVSSDGLGLDVHETFEEALEQIIEMGE